jgi:hypothetical protein
MNEIMKKYYNQPIVEATDLIATSQALCASPGGTGIQNGGDTQTSGIGGGTPIGD